MAQDSVSFIRQASLETRDAVPRENVENLFRKAFSTNELEILEIKAPSATGVSSGGLFVEALIKGEPARLFVKFDTGAPVRPFHIYDLTRQFVVQRHLHKSGVPVPEPVYLDERGAILGKPGFVMKVVAGEPGSSKAWSEGALADSSPDQRIQMLRSAAETMVAMHAVDVSDSGLRFLHEQAKGESAFAREIQWTLDLAAYHNFSDARIERSADMLRRRLPEGTIPVFNHGDNKFDNYLFRNGSVSAVIDFEMSFAGPKELDLAYLLFTTSMLSPPDDPKPDWYPDESQLLQLYEDAGGAKVEDWDYCKDLIAFKFSVMVLAFTSRLGLLAQAPAMFAGYWSEIGRIGSKER